MSATLPAVQLRTMQAGDWPAFLQLHQDENLSRYVFEPMDEEQLRQRFASRLLPWTVHSQHFMAEVIEDNHGQWLGLIGLRSDWANRQAEVGCLIVPAAQGRGVASAALQLLLCRAFTEYGYHKITATITVGNDASIRLFSRHGFVQEGLFRQHFYLNGQFHDDIKLGLLKSDWLASR